jgi:hypothetical protein
MEVGHYLPTKLHSVVVEVEKVGMVEKRRKVGGRWPAGHKG